MDDDEGPPPFVVPPLEDDDDVEVAPFAGHFAATANAPLDALKLPCSVSRSPSPSPIPNSDHRSEEGDENGFDTPPPIQMETLKEVSISSPGGIESFLEREAIRSDDLPVHCIGLSPAVSREPSPCPRREEKDVEETLPNGLDHAEPPREEQTEEQPSEVDQASPSESIDNGEEDDDFGDFGFAPPPPPVDHQAKKDLSTVTEEDDDWDAFQSSSAVSERKEGVAVDESDDWAAFEAAAPAAQRQPSLDDDDDWATDFASAPPLAAAAAPAAQSVVEVPTLPSLADLSIDEGIWIAEDTVEDDDEDGLAFDLYARLDADDPRSVKGGEEEGQLMVSASLWLALRVVEEAAALRHTWEGSRTARQLYDLLQISATRPMQRAQLAAAAAPSPDAVLQPTRIGEMNGKSARAVTLSTSNSSISHVSAYSTTTASSTPAANSTTTTASTSLGSGCLVPSTSSQSVSPVARSPAADTFIAPPVDFDWEKSNLKTPAMQISSSTMLDMDYFSGAGGGPPKIISSDSTLQRDLDAFGLSATSASAGMPRVESTPSVLDTILSSARAGASSTPRYLAPAELSLDARALHDSLPSLDHLAASWIAFPVRDNGDC